MNDMKQKDNTMRKTPETDEATRTTDWLSGEPMVPSEFARRLECERDEARDAARRMLDAINTHLNPMTGRQLAHAFMLDAATKAKEVLGEA